MSSPDEIASDPERVVEAFIDCERAGWTPGDPCPNCGHGNVYAIIRAGVIYRDTGGWELNKTLGVYEAFCPRCEWLPPVRHA